MDFKSAEEAYNVNRRSVISKIFPWYLCYIDLKLALIVRATSWNYILGIFNSERTPLMKFFSHNTGQ